MKRPLPIVLAATVAVAGVGSGSASASSWYWSPGVCKSNLRQYGMRLDDGRTFQIAQSFCVGKGGPASCAWNKGHIRRLYNHFVVFARSYDGGVRGFDLYPTGRKSYRATGIRLLGHESNAAHFNRVFSQIANDLSQRENEKGCAH